jgi:hypothetical protein
LSKILENLVLVLVPALVLLADAIPAVTCVSTFYRALEKNGRKPKLIAKRVSDPEKAYGK